VLADFRIIQDRIPLAAGEFTIASNRTFSHAIRAATLQDKLCFGLFRPDGRKNPTDSIC
jgi:hypothetical protein